MYVLVVEEVLRNSLVRVTKEIIEESQNSCPYEIHNSLILILCIQHVINFKWYAKLFISLPFIHDQKDKDDSNLLSYVRSISTHILISVCLILQPQSHSVHDHKPKRYTHLILVSPHTQMSKLLESFVCTILDLCVGMQIMNNTNFKLIYKSVIIT